jgi:hypothetical protein
MSYDPITCDGTGRIDYPHRYRRYGPPEDLDPPGVWEEACPGCEECEPEEEEEDT